MWRWYSDRGVSQSGPPRGWVDICCLWGPVTWNYRLNQVLSVSFALLHLLALYVTFSPSSPLLQSFPVGSLFLYTLLSYTSHTFFLLALFSLTFLVCLSHPHHTYPLLSSRPPASRSQGEDPASCSWVLLKLQLRQPACSSDVPKPQGSSDLRMKCKIYSRVNAESVREEAKRGRMRR